MKLHPIRDVVVIERVEDGKSAGGIELLDSHKDPAGTDTGVVIAVERAYISDSGAWINIDCKVGEKVLFMRKHAITVKGSKTLVCVRNANVLAVVEE